jgi:acyl-CoA dehydrogenase
VETLNIVRRWAQLDQLSIRIAQLGVEALGTMSRRWRSPTELGGVASQLAHVLVPEYCNSRAYTIFGGASEIQLGLIAKNLLDV